MTKGKEPTQKEALRDLRNAERLAAVAHRGKIAAEGAASAASDAADAAVETAEAARTALAASARAEKSATKSDAETRVVGLSKLDALPEALAKMEGATATTAAAARSALAASTLADASATTTATAATAAGRSTRADLEADEADTGKAEINEVAAQRRYRNAVARGAARSAARRS
jgi:hypothetical protein